MPYYILTAPKDVTLSRNVEQRDDAGGVSITGQAPVGAGTPGKAPGTYTVDEMVPGNQGQRLDLVTTGDRVVVTRIFVFLPPYPAILPDDLIISDTGQYRVKFGEKYDTTMQVIATTA